MSKMINLADGLSLNAEDLIESAIGVIGKRGRGKSGAVKVLMEELIRVRLPFVAFDPVGIMWGLRSSLDGKGPGLPVLVIGGAHGDVRLDRRAGATVARAIVQANVSCIIDFSEEPRAAYREFVRDFLHELFKINDTSRMVIIEETPELAPQRLRPDLYDVYEAVERIVLRGRNKGIGVTLVSQRAATINKDVLTQVDALLVFGVTSPQDRKALKEWVEAKGDTGRLEQFENGIAGLKRQEAWFWSPEAFDGMFKQVRIHNFKTFHPDKTHLRREGLLEQKPVTTDVSEIVSKLGSQLERFRKEKDELALIPKLQGKIRQLEKDNELMHAQLPLKFKQDPVADINARIKHAVAEAKAPLIEEVKQLRGVVHQFQGREMAIRKALQKYIESPPNVPQIQTEEPKSSAYRSYATDTKTLPTIRTTAREKVTVSFKQGAEENGEFRITRGHEKIISALTSLHSIGIAKPKKSQVALWAGYSPTSGGYFNYLGQLRSAGFIDYGDSATMFLTKDGTSYAGTMKEPPHIPNTVEELQEQVFRMIGESKSRILKVLIAADRNPISKPELAEQAGYSPTSGGYYNYLGNLRTMGLIEYVGGGVRAADILFLEGG